VGDWVYAKYFNQDSFAVINEIFPRKTILKRKTSGKKIEFQLIAANIETAFIVQSLDYNYNLWRLERYLAMINESKRDETIKWSIIQRFNQRHQLFLTNFFFKV